MLRTNTVENTQVCCILLTRQAEEDQRLQPTADQHLGVRRAPSRGLQETPPPGLQRH